MPLTVLVDREGRIAISHAGVVDPSATLRTGSVAGNPDCPALFPCLAAQGRGRDDKALRENRSFPFELLRVRMTRSQFGELRCDLNVDAL